MDKVLAAFLLPPPQGVYELEARYRGYGNAALTRPSYNGAIRALGGLGFKPAGGAKLLRVALQGLRVEIAGLYAVQASCRTEALPDSATVLRKKKVMVHDTDYGMRLALSTEQELGAGELQQVRNDWGSHPKKFRFMHRVAFKQARGMRQSLVQRGRLFRNCCHCLFR